MSQQGQFQDVAAERAVLGSVLMDTAVLANVQEIISPDDMSVPAHADIFRAFMALDARSEKIDPLTVAEQLTTDGKLASAGGPGYLAQLDQAVPFAQNAVEYAKIIKNQATRRLLAGAGKEILELAAAQYLEQTKVMLEKDGAIVEAILVRGDPPSQIVACAQNIGCDLIARSTHAHKFLGDLIFGSVATAVRHMTDIPVLLVPGGKRK